MSLIQFFNKLNLIFFIQVPLLNEYHKQINLFVLLHERVSTSLIKI